ncbi:MAG: OadG family protein [Bacteroidales bacterium]|nr:OadG family protein [Bacteroidales bacterium]MBN2817701.1 OadG family protein [Bacteroidales bacterium]
MEQNLGNALSIMIVGMVTVFLILWLVVLIGNALIRLTNKFWPESEISKKANAALTASDGTVAAIIAAVDVVTKGKGKITKITKL